MLLFVGLGNPGPRYAFNRHNIGFMALDAIAECYDFSPENEKKRFHAILREGTLGGQPVIALKPTTFMNEAGRAVAEALHFYKLSLSDVTVFHDEVDLAPGKLRVKQGGGAAGHNGIRSITEYVGAEFRRVRLGVGHPGERTHMSGHVLGDFSRAEQNGFLPVFLGAIAAAASLLAENRADAFMSRVADDMRELTKETGGSGNGI
jgi:PTH1 family peptidyl-tRNA hydrolase